MKKIISISVCKNADEIFLRTFDNDTHMYRTFDNDTHMYK